MLRLWLGMEILDMYKNMQDSFRLGFLTEHIDTLYANRVVFLHWKGQEVILVGSKLHIEVKNLKMLVLNNILSDFWAFQLQEIFDISQLT